MKYCMNCGAELGEGRFCTNCGTPVGSATPPVEPSPAYGPPTTFQLPSAAPAGAHAAPPPGRTKAAAKASTRTPRPTRRAARPASGHPHWTGWLLLVIGLAIAVALGSCLARDPGDKPEPAATPSASPSASPRTSTSPTPVQTGRAGIDLARTSTVTAPPEIRPGTDLAGQPVPYPATNMLDGKRDSAYRLAGDATGTVIRFDLGGDHIVSAVGLVNGYAKVDGATDWYPLNRRITTVEWRFADGTTIVQELVDTNELQAMQISPETTSWVEMRLVKVSAPGTKDTTAISDVLLLGS